MQASLVSLAGATAADLPPLPLPSSPPEQHASPTPRSPVPEPSSGGLSGGIGIMSATGMPSTFAAPSLLDLPQTTPPPALNRAAITLDSIRARTVMFGGCSTSTPCATAETWAFDGDQWTRQLPVTSPTARHDATLTFDATRGYAVLFGGTSATGAALNDTWTWDGSNWTLRTPSTSPGARAGAHAAYLPSIGKVVLFGGVNGSTRLADTWTWSGSTWTQVATATSPPGRSHGGMAQANRAGGALVLYGGRNGNGTNGLLGDTWTFDGTTWTAKAPPATPGPLERFSMDYDAVLHMPMIEGGHDGNSYFSDLWVWDGADWVVNGGNLTLHWGSFDGTANSAMARTPKNGHLVMVGGEYSATTRQGETFKIDYPDIGEAPYYSLQTKRLTDRAQDSVNLANANFLYRETDMAVQGVNGLNFVVQRQFNGLDSCNALLLTCGWTMGFLDMATYFVPDGSRVIHGPDGRELFFSGNGDGTWTAPPGSDMTLVQNADGTRTLTKLHENTKYNFTAGYLTSVVERNGNRITLTRNTSNRITSITDTQGRVYTFAYTAQGHLQSITDPTGRSVTYGYTLGTSLDMLTSVTVSDPNDPTPAEVTRFAYDGEWPLNQVTTPAGRVTKYQFGNMSRLTRITRVDNVGAGTGPVTVIDTLGTPGKLVVTDANSHSTTHTPDTTGTGSHTARVGQVVDANGNTRQTSYDANQNVTSFNGANVSSVFRLTWDLNNNLSRFARPSSNGTNTPAGTDFAYNTPGQLYLPSSRTDSDGDCRSFRYNPNGMLTDVYEGQSAPCDGLGGGTHLVNRYQGDPGGACGAKPGQLCSSTDGNGNTTGYSYDANGNVTGMTPPAPLGATTVTPDALGRASTVTDGKAQTTRYTYDKNGRITRILYGGATTCSSSATCTTFAYDADGNLTKRADNAGTVTNTYDNLGRLARTSGYQGAVKPEVPVAHWRLGETSGTTAVDVSGNGRNGTYSGAVALGVTGALVGDSDTGASFDGSTGKVTVPDSTTLRLSGNFTIEFWAKLDTFRNTFPGIVRKGDSATANGYLIFYASDGKLTFKRNNVSISSNAGALTGNYRHFAVTYDGTNLRWYIDGALQTTTAVTYPANAGTSSLLLGQGDHAGDQTVDEVAMYDRALTGSQVAAHRQAGNAGTAYGYDPVGNLTTFTDGGGQVAYGYDNANQLVSLAEPGGNCGSTPSLCTRFGYVDDTGKYQDGRRTKTTFPSGATMNWGYDQAGNVTSTVGKNATGGVLTSFSYTYAVGASDREQRRTVTQADGGGNTTTTYSYDSSGRLLQAQQTAGGTDNRSWTYDANGNRLTQTINGVVTNYAYNAGNELCWTGSTAGTCGAPPTGATTFTFDANGNQTSNSAGQALVYNNKDQTTSMKPAGGSAVAMTYADVDQTQRLSVGSTYAFQSALGISSERTTSGTTTYYIRDNEGNLVTENVNGTRYHYLTDGIGSVVGLLGSSSTATTLTNRYGYDAFGNQTLATGTAPNVWRFAGGYRDPTGFYKFGARYYDPGVGRWTQQDPVAGCLVDPAAVNRFVYVENDPVNLTDHSGRDVDINPEWAQCVDGCSDDFDIGSIEYLICVEGCDDLYPQFIELAVAVILVATIVIAFA
ncbi:MAG: hypothetical protein M3422_11495 [Actinomycetota bacterium]|nr:hypothetical protein [Actinomycetota bacterium]